MCITKMKKLLALTLLLVVAFAVPAMAALKMLPEELALELEGIAKEYWAAEKNVSVDSLTVSEAWVRELFNIEKDVYIVGFGKEDFVYVDVAEKAVLTVEEIDALVAEDLANEPDEPVFRTMAIGIEAGDGDVHATEAEEEKSSNTAYYVGGALVIGLGAGALLLRGRK